METKKIAFCITCMNRLNHLQQTLEKNIRDNYLPEEVEFVLLDYNSKDGLEEWVRQNMQQYIDAGILVYYKTFEPEYYLRSHSRNMAFRLANAEILCNLDADNFLGKGFAAFIIQEFSKYDEIFYTNNYSLNDTYGRVCVRIEDFMSIRGYNEALKGYGYEDNDFQNQLIIHGLKPMSFHNPEFYRFVLHSDDDRVSEEFMAKNVNCMYISYINPYTSAVLLLYKDFAMEQYKLTDNSQINEFAETSTVNELFLNENRRVVIGDDMLKGSWNEDNNTIYIQENNVKYEIQKEVAAVHLKGLTFYKIEDKELKAKLFVLLNSAINYYEACQQMKNKSVINPDGFGKGCVFKNFDLSKEIILS